MRGILILLFAGLLLTPAVFAQKQRSFPAGVPVKETGAESNGGQVEGRTYSNSKFGFKLAVPESWFIAGPDFEAILKENGHDLATEAGSRSGRSMDILMTAFRSEKGRAGAVLRISVESLASYPQIRDAVDYLDAITAAYASANLPADFSYSSVKAEALGPRQFAYLDTLSSSGKKRLYATVRGRSAILFTLSYTEDSDLQAARGMLSQSEFTSGSPKN